tara:strand:+ start:248 stop:985 length:738 start_codon:yes stop_codon:yes gene_type:complete
MPNWCENTLIIGNTNNKLETFFNENKTNDNELDFNCVCPVPNELYNTESHNKNNDNYSKELEKKYGYSDWYTWCCNNWGTKWNSSDVDYYKEDNTITYSFNTAWGPPGEWFKKLCDKYSDFELTLKYEECGMDFGGIMTYTNNELLEEEYTLSEYIWENCNQNYVYETINHIISNNDDDLENIDDLTDQVIEILYDEINNAHSIYSVIYDKITEELQNKTNDIESLKDSILHYNDKGINIENFNL